MITLLHFSDIHFHNPAGGEQFNLDAQLRRLILEDVKSKPAGGTNYDGLLVCGDIAYSGKKEQYDLAEKWLQSIEQETGIEPANTYIVPGNHDVDRDYIPVNGLLHDSHNGFRNCANEAERSQKLHTLLTKERKLTPLAPLDAYNVFAQKYGCRTQNQLIQDSSLETPPRLAWEVLFPKPLDDGSCLRLHGLNSALISDAKDDLGLLYISPFQTQHFQHDPNYVNLVMCHHPLDWLLDKQDIEKAISSYASIALFGHQHLYQPRCIDKTVHIHSGAMHPERAEAPWKPTYHIIQIEVRCEGKMRQLHTRIYTRVLSENSHTFIPLPSDQGKDFVEINVVLPEKPVSISIPVVQNSSSSVSSSLPDMATTSINMPVGAYRELRVHFHRLSTPLRMRVATDLELIRDGDDLPPVELWDLVFHRAKIENRFHELWERTAKENPALTMRQNPFS